MGSPNPKTPAVNPKRPMEESVKEDMVAPVAATTPLKQEKAQDIREDIKNISSAPRKKTEMPESESKIF